MTIQEIPGEGMLTLKVEGKVDSYTGDEFSEHVTDACQKNSYVRLDLTEAPYFSSAGLRGLIMGYKVSNVKKGKLELYGVNDGLFKTLQDTGLDRSLTIITLKEIREGGAEGSLRGGNEAVKIFAESEKGSSTERGQAGKKHGMDVENSPSWVVSLPEAGRTDQLFIVAAYERSTAWVSLHEMDETGRWGMVMSTVGFIGREGLGQSRESMKTPLGSYPFSRFILTYPDDRRPFTDGRIAIPEDKLGLVLSHVTEQCIMVVDTLANLGGDF
ncbi:MAG: STAS domain-containing protein [Lachnospiraceae bacterium]|nr:STAS domain-containing protein [Lachnospiraceae bacterium]